MNTPNQTPDPDDLEWLNALAGRPTPGIDASTLLQARAVRQAVLERRAALEADAQAPDAARLESLRQRLKKEGLLHEPGLAVQPGLTGWKRWLSGLGGGGIGSRTGHGAGALAPARWVLVLAIVIGLLWVLRLTLPGPGPDPVPDVLRGGTAAVLIVDDPAQRLAELRQGLKDAKAVFTEQTLPDGRLQLDIEASEAALDYLQSQRITPPQIDGKVRLLLQKTP